jgi:hypothetical protein
MTVGSEHKAQVVVECNGASLPEVPQAGAPVQFGEELRRSDTLETDPTSFESVHGHEDWYRSLRYPQ